MCAEKGRMVVVLFVDVFVDRLQNCTLREHMLATQVNIKSSEDRSVDWSVIFNQINFCTLVQISRCMSATKDFRREHMLPATSVCQFSHGNIVCINNELDGSIICKRVTRLQNLFAGYCRSAQCHDITCALFCSGILRRMKFSPLSDIALLKRTHMILRSDAC